MRVEHLDRRVLGAVRFVDAVTGSRILDPLAVSAPGVRWIRNRQNHYVIAGAPGLEAYAESFQQPPGDVPPGSVAIELTAADPDGRYLARRHTLRVPRDPDPAKANQPDSLFRTADVRLFPSPTAAAASGWAVIRATVTAQGTDRRLAGALIRVLRASDSKLLAAGLSDSRGEAMVAVPGIPVTTWEAGTGPVLATEVEVTLETVFDPVAGAPPDPDDLEARRSRLAVSRSSVRLASGRTFSTAISVTLP